MATQKRYEFPHADAIPVKCEEGQITRGDIEDGGLIIEDAISARASRLKKGDKVIIYNDTSSGGEIVVQKVTLGSNEVNDVHGVLIDDPTGADDVTASGATPVHSLRRSATVRFKGHRMTMENVTSAGAIRAGYSVKYSESAEGVIEGSATLANGDAIAAAYTAASGKVPVLEGYYGFRPAD